MVVVQGRPSYISSSSAGIRFLERVVRVARPLVAATLCGYGLSGWEWKLRDLVWRDSSGIVVWDDVVECLVPNIPGCVFNGAASFVGGADAAVTEGTSDSTLELAASCFLPGLQ
jgi:hypothetical protein